MMNGEDLRCHAPSAGSQRPGAPARPAAAGKPPAHGLLLRAEIERVRLHVGRYPLEAAASLVLFAFMFLVFAALGTMMGGRLSPFGGDPRVLALLYALWMIASTTIAGGAAQLAADAAIGVLETLFLATAPLTRLLHVRAVAHALHGLASATLLLAAFCMSTRWWPGAAACTALAAGVAGCVVTSLGLAMALSGAALRFKRVGVLLLPVNFLCMLAVMGGPAQQAAEQASWTLALPYVAGSAALRSALAHGEAPVGLMAIAVLAALPWWLAGRAVLARCEIACRRAGTTHVY
jgi:hypothetical protein